MEYKGFAKKVFEKNGRHSILCDDDNWYGHGHTKPQCSDNDLIKFTYTKNGQYNNIDEGSVQRKDNPNPPVEKAAYQKKGGGGGSGFQADKAAREKYWADKEIWDKRIQKIISFNGALNLAERVVNGAVANDLIKLGGKAGEKYGAYFAMIMEEAETIYKTLQNVPSNHVAIMGGSEKAVEVPDDVLPDDDVPADQSNDEDDW
jgi:hypothetical protein